MIFLFYAPALIWAQHSKIQMKWIRLLCERVENSTNRKTALKTRLYFSRRANENFGLFSFRFSMIVTLLMAYLSTALSVIHVNCAQFDVTCVGCRALKFIGQIPFVWRLHIRCRRWHQKLAFTQSWHFTRSQIRKTRIPLSLWLVALQKKKNCQNWTRKKCDFLRWQHKINVARHRRLSSLVPLSAAQATHAICQIQIEIVHTLWACFAEDYWFFCSSSLPAAVVSTSLFNHSPFQNNNRTKKYESKKKKI